MADETHRLERQLKEEKLRAERFEAALHEQSVMMQAERMQAVAVREQQAVALAGAKHEVTRLKQELTVAQHERREVNSIVEHWRQQLVSKAAFIAEMFGTSGSQNGPDAVGTMGMTLQTCTDKLREANEHVDVAGTGAQACRGGAERAIAAVYVASAAHIGTHRQRKWVAKEQQRGAVAL